MDEFESDGPGQERPSAPSSRNPLQVVWRHRYLVLLGGVAGLVLGALYYAQKAPVYQSGAQILVVKKRSDVLPTGTDSRLSFYEDYVSTHLVLIRSPLVVQRAVKKRDLTSLTCFAGVGDPTGIILAGLTAGRDTPKEAGAAPNNIINLGYRGGSAETGTVLAAVIQSYQDYLDEIYLRVSGKAVEEIRAARDFLKKDLEEKETSYREFRKTSPHLGRTADGNIYLARMRDFQAKQTGLMA
ncbi:MAG: Wzz/FepE/Etk N-terminal domain-containing protein, partial [Gemmataceae bacterium]